MIFKPLGLKGSYCIELSPHEDQRGAFTRVFCMNELGSIGHEKNIVQVNHSLTREAGTVRGMHFQHPPKTETKMVMCLRGRVFDVIVDLRRGSENFLGWEGVELSGVNHRMMYIPPGFAHGFQTLESDCELLYFHSEFFSPEFEDGIPYDDESVRISWPLPTKLLSPRDMSHKTIAQRGFEGITI